MMKRTSFWTATARTLAAGHKSRSPYEMKNKADRDSQDQPFNMRKLFEWGGAIVVVSIAGIVALVLLLALTTLVLKALFQRHRGCFSEKRRDGARAMRGAQWGGLFTARDLRKCVITAAAPAC